MNQVRAVEFDDDGRPVPVLRRPLDPQRMTRILSSALVHEYTPVRDPVTYELAPGEERFIGMTNIEVGAIRQAEAFSHGSDEAAKFIFDRILGKPKQQIEQTSMNFTLQDYLKAMAQKNAAAKNDVSPHGREATQMQSISMAPDIVDATIINLAASSKYAILEGI